MSWEVSSRSNCTMRCGDGHVLPTALCAWPLAGSVLAGNTAGDLYAAPHSTLLAQQLGTVTCIATLHHLAIVINAEGLAHVLVLKNDGGDTTMDMISHRWIARVPLNATVLRCCESQKAILMILGTNNGCVYVMQVDEQEHQVHVTLLVEALPWPVVDLCLLSNRLAVIIGLQRGFAIMESSSDVLEAPSEVVLREQELDGVCIRLIRDTLIMASSSGCVRVYRWPNWDVEKEALFPVGSYPLSIHDAAGKALIATAQGRVLCFDIRTGSFEKSWKTNTRIESFCWDNDSSVATFADFEQLHIAHVPELTSVRPLDLLSYLQKGNNNHRILLNQLESLSKRGDVEHDPQGPFDRRLDALIRNLLRPSSRNSRR